MAGICSLLCRGMGWDKARLVGVGLMRWIGCHAAIGRGRGKEVVGVLETRNVLRWECLVLLTLLRRDLG